MRMFAITMAALGLLCAALASAVPAEAQTPGTTAATVSVYAKALRKVNPQLPKWQSQDLARRVLVNAERWSLDANMLVAVVTVESHWHTHAVSRAGAIGLGQLMPGTAAKLGVNPHNAAENLSGAARYLNGLMQRFGSHYDLVFAAYNAGPKAVANYGGIPPYGETQQYVVRVMSAWQYFAKTIHLPEADASNGGPDLAYWLEAPTK